MKKLPILCVCLCLLLLLAPGKTPLSAEESPPSFSFDDMDSFVGALRDEEMADYIGKNDLALAPDVQVLPFPARYPFLKDNHTWHAFASAYREFNGVGYVPVPALQEEAQIEYTDNFSTPSSTLTYVYQTEAGEIQITFHLRGDDYTYSAEKTYAAWKNNGTSEKRLAYVSMQHGATGVLLLVPSGQETEEPASPTFLQSCHGNAENEQEGAPATGMPYLKVQYHDFEMLVRFRYQTDLAQAIAFMEGLGIQKSEV